jgi:hypothetical protein
VFLVVFSCFLVVACKVNLRHMHLSFVALLIWSWAKALCFKKKWAILHEDTRSTLVYYLVCLDMHKVLQ